MKEEVGKEAGGARSCGAQVLKSSLDLFQGNREQSKVLSTGWVGDTSDVYWKKEAQILLKMYPLFTICIEIKPK